MATTKHSDVVEPGTPVDLTITNFARFSVIWRNGPLLIEMIEPDSAAGVPVNDGSASYGSVVGDMVGVTLRLTATGSTNVNVTVYEE